jgi:hypothetical protein
MRPWGDVRVVAACFAACLAFPAWSAGQNLVVNGNFDGDVLGWKIVRGDGTEVWDPLDFQNDPASGSMHLTNTGVEPNAFTVSGQCIELIPSGTYEFGTDVRFPAGSMPGAASVVVGWFGNPCCSGPPLAAGTSPPVSSADSGVWVETFTPALSAPAGTVAVGVGVALLKLEGGSPQDAVAAFRTARAPWESPACPEGGPARAAPRIRAPAGPKGATLDALFDRVRFGLSGTTPAQLQSFSVE